MEPKRYDTNGEVHECGNGLLAYLDDPAIVSALRAFKAMEKLERLQIVLYGEHGDWSLVAYKRDGMLSERIDKVVAPSLVSAIEQIKEG